MSVLQTVLVFVVPALAIYLLVSLLAAGRRRGRRPRYRPGEPWPYEPVWWQANPDGAALPGAAHPGSAPSGSRGGAEGGW